MRTVDSVGKTYGFLLPNKYVTGSRNVITYVNLYAKTLMCTVDSVGTVGSVGRSVG